MGQHVAQDASLSAPVQCVMRYGMVLALQYSDQAGRQHRAAHGRSNPSAGKLETNFLHSDRICKTFALNLPTLSGHHNTSPQQLQPSKLAVSYY